jgi:hypothetical protein
MPYIKDYCVKEIESKGEIQNIIGEYVTLKRKGSDLVGECPFCNAKDKFTVSKQKELWKCFVCDTGGVGYLSFVRKITGKTYPETLELLAAKLNITVDYEEKEQTPTEPNKLPAAHKLPKADRKDNFRDIQLRESGLTDADQKYNKKNESVEGVVEIDRYQKGSVNADWTIDPNGDDMVMHYMDLNGKPMTYQRKGQSKDFPLIRVRYANPSVHLDKNLRPMKYQSPYGSGTHVWINQTLRSLYENGTKIKRLFIQEGEKKADKATKHGIVSIGIMGIHNIATNKHLPREFELVIKRCDVEDVVFIVDSDFLDISDNTQSAIDQRPRSFVKAIINFRDYFFALNNSGISLGIFFGYIKPDQGEKGIDDLLQNKLKKIEHLLLEDIQKTILEPSGIGTYINVHKITSFDEYKLRKEFFHMETNQQFADFHYEKLKDRATFKIGRELFKFSNLQDNPELPERTLVLAQPLSNAEQFWQEKTVKRGDSVEVVTTFKYLEAVIFLENRYFGKYRISEGAEPVYIKIEKSIVSIVTPADINEYVVSFVRYALQKLNVTEMIFKGSRMYLNSDLFNKLEYIPLNFHRSGKGVQYNYFKDTMWKITAQGIEEKSISELNGHVWKDDIKKRAAIKLPDLVRVKLNEKGKYEIVFPNGAEHANKCDFFRFLLNTSNFYWRDTHEGLYSKKDPETPRQAIDEFKRDDITLHFISKCVALGYLCHTHFDPSVTKAVIGMDGKLSEVGSSNGRSGKTIFGTAITKLITTFEIPGKSKDLMEDKHVFEGVTDATRCVFIDDVRTNFDFEFLFPMITGMWKINPKGKASFPLQKQNSPKIYLPTNHAINGEGGSFRARQFLIAFSDYYNEDYTPIDDFGRYFFDEWDTEQWNLFYNLIGNCLQIYFEHGLVAAPMDRLELRKLRQQIGEAFLDWAELYYDPERESDSIGGNGCNINKDIERSICYKSFIDMFPMQGKYTDSRKFKQLLQKWCIYKGYEFNPGCEKGYDKRNGKEYFTVANDEYKKDKMF